MARDYKREYALWGGTDSAKKKRADCNKLRRNALKKGTVKKGDNFDMAHTKNGAVKKHRSVNRGSKSDQPGDVRARGGKNSKLYKKKKNK